MDSIFLRAKNDFMITRFFYLAISCVLLLPIETFSSPIDSVGSEVIDGKVFVLYRVESGESVYSIATKYGASMRDIVSATPEVKKGLQIGMVIKVPYSGKAKSTVSSKEVEYHIVKSGETLYGISRIYKISVDEIIEWNQLKSTGLDIGQKLLVQGVKTHVEPIKVVVERGNQIHTVAQGEGLYGIARIYNISVDDILKWNQLQSTSLQVGQKLIVGISANGNYVHPTKLDTLGVSLSTRYEIEKVIESGVASIIEGSENTIKYLALHRTAKVGAIIAVKNEMNDQMVFVRVIGKLPNTGVNSKIVIRISDAAYKKLGAIDSKFRVQLSYLPDR